LGTSYIRYFKKNYKENTNFLDIGSNYGCHTIGIANEIRKNKGSGKVYSFYLQPEIIKLFKENVNMNNLNDIVILNEVGLGDKNETKEFIVSKDYDNNDNPGGSSLYNSDNSDKNKKEFVTIKRLDDLNIDNISLIKIDVEGYELEAFEGGINTITKNKPIIVIEIWSNNLEKYTKWINSNFPFYSIENISKDDYILKKKY
jgi:FkbM family methyltransferase